MKNIQMHIIYWSRMYWNVFDFGFIIITVNARSSHVSSGQRGSTSQSVHNGTESKIIETKLIKPSAFIHCPMGGNRIYKP